MNNRDKRIDQIFTHLTNAANAAADSMTDAVQSAGHVVSEKYDSVKLTFELNRLQEEQRKLFTDIGRTMYMLTSNDLSNKNSSEASPLDAQQMVDRFLLLADQKQQEIDHLSERLANLNGSKICAVCGEVSGGNNTFCSACGVKL